MHMCTMYLYALASQRLDSLVLVPKSKEHKHVQIYMDISIKIHVRIS